MPKQDNPLEAYQEYARELLSEHNDIYFESARVLGHKNLRASIWRLLNKDCPPSPRLREALKHWANIKPFVLIIPRQEWERHSITCAVCGKQTPRWSPNQRYCPEHSWATPEGRRWHRQRKKEHQLADLYATLPTEEERDG